MRGGLRILGSLRASCVGVCREITTDSTVCHDRVKRSALKRWRVAHHHSQHASEQRTPVAHLRSLRQRRLYVWHAPEVDSISKGKIRFKIFEGATNAAVTWFWTT